MYRTPVEPTLELSSEDTPRATAKSRIVIVLALIATVPLVAALCLPKAPRTTTLGIEVAAAPPEAEPPLLRRADLLRVAPISPRTIDFMHLATELHTHRELAFAFAGRVCRATEGSSRIACKELPAEDAEMFAPRAPGFGPRFVRDKSFGWSHRRSDGTTVTLNYREEFGDRLRLAIGSHETMWAPPKDIATGPLFYGAALVPGFIVFRGVNDAREYHLFAQPVRATDVGPAVDIGEIGPWYAVGISQQVVGCDSGEAFSVAVKSRPNVEGTYRWYVTTNHDGAWTATAMVTAFDNMTCRHGEVSLTGVANDVVRQWTCANGSCAVREAQLPESPARAAVSTDTAVVTVANKGRGLRLRVGAIDKLAEAPERLLLDGEEAGPDGWLGGFELLPAGSATALIINTTQGAFVVRIDSAGVVTPLDAG